MKRLTNYLKVTTILLVTLNILVYTGLITAHAEEARYATANLDIVDGKEVRMPRTSTGVVVDGYQLNHDYVKILNINDGNIVINDETYTQGTASGPWSSQEDAYVIKGTGTSPNTITISPTSNEITVYLVDLAWNGYIHVTGKPVNVNLVICGNVTNRHATHFISVSSFNGKLSVTGLSGQGDAVTANTTFLYHQNYPVVMQLVEFKNFSIDTKNFYVITHNGYYNQMLNLVNVMITNNVNQNLRDFVDINILNSYIKNFDMSANNLNITGSKIDNISVAPTSLSVVDSEIYNIAATSSTLTANNSFINYGSPVTGVVNCTNTTLNLNSVSPSSFSKISLMNSSIYSVVNFTGTPVDDQTNDLFVKKLRIRQYPNTYVWLSVDNGEEARLKTDANGFLYPYVKKGTVRVDARIENGQKFFADFSPTTGSDTSTTNLLSIVESTPTITDHSESQTIQVGETLSISISAEPGTAGKGLSYQWYKNNVKLLNDTQSTLTRVEALTEDSGTYKCVVKEDGGGTVTSEDIKVTVRKPAVSNIPVLTSQTSKMELTEGDTVTLIVTATPSLETNTLSYEWYKGDILVSSEGSQLKLENISKEHEGQYKCVITEENFNTTVVSEPFVISVE